MTKVIAVTKKDLKDQKAKKWVDFHPEDYCHRCGQRNIQSWYVKPEIWEQVYGKYKFNGIICPQCFTEDYAEAMGDWITWEIKPG